MNKQNNIKNTKININFYKNSKKILEKKFNKNIITIGRNPNSDCPLPYENTISFNHAKIEMKGDGWYLIDLNSTNGISYQGEKKHFLKLSEGVQIINICKIEVHINIENDNTFENTNKTDKIDINELNLNSKKPNSKEPTLNYFPSETKTLPRNLQKFTATNAEVINEVLDEEATDLQTHHLSSYGFYNNATHLFKGRRKQKVVEGYLIWKDVLYDICEFYPGEKIIVSRNPNYGLYLPISHKELDFGNFNGHKLVIKIPKKLSFTVNRNNEKLNSSALFQRSKMKFSQSKFLFFLEDEDLCEIKIDKNISLFLRYNRKPKSIGTRINTYSDERFIRISLTSSIVHFAILLIAIIMAPEIKGPEMKEIPKRYVKLIVPQKKEIKLPPTKLPPKPPIKKIVKKTDPPKKIKKRALKKKKTKVAKNIKIKRKAKLRTKIVKARPVRDKISVRSLKKQIHNVPPQPKQKKISQLGALGALSGLKNPIKNPGSPNLKHLNKSQFFAPGQINKNAGGGKGLQTGKLIGNLKAKGGKLAASGFDNHVGVIGMGMGTGYGPGVQGGKGSGYGMSGLKGETGKRGVAGAVVGNPQLFTMKTEGLDRNQVMSVVKKYLPEIQRCYETSLLSNPSLSGRVEYEWHITPQGRVTWIKVKKSQMSGGDVLHSCVKKIFKRMKFANAKNGEPTIPTIGFPFGKL